MKSSPKTHSCGEDARVGTTATFGFFLLPQSHDLWFSLVMWPSQGLWSHDDTGLRNVLGHRVWSLTVSTASHCISIVADSLKYFVWHYFVWAPEQAILFFSNQLTRCCKIQGQMNLPRHNTTFAHILLYIMSEQRLNEVAKVLSVISSNRASGIKKCRQILLKPHPNKEVNMRRKKHACVWWHHHQLLTWNWFSLFDCRESPLLQDI